MKDIKSLITEVAEQSAAKTVSKLKKAGLLRDGEKQAIKKTEDLLRQYENFKVLEHDPGTPAAVMIEKIETAIDLLQNDDYCGLIEMLYFEHKTREECAEFYGVDPITITRNKRRLLEKIKNIIFADDAIKEIFNL